MCKKFGVFKITASWVSRTHVFQQIPVRYIIIIIIHTYIDALGSQLGERFLTKL